MAIPCTKERYSMSLGQGREQRKEQSTQWCWSYAIKETMSNPWRSHILPSPHIYLWHGLSTWPRIFAYSSLFVGISFSHDIEFKHCTIPDLFQFLFLHELHNTFSRLILCIGICAIFEHFAYAHLVATNDSPMERGQLWIIDGMNTGTESQ